jgi:CO dehydrogenase maturation factor
MGTVAAAQFWQPASEERKQMTITIAVAGKGGTGKTTLTSLLIQQAIDEKWGSVLAIDADPSSNLNQALGLPLDGTVGDIREDALDQVKSGSFPVGTSKQDYLDYQINQCLVEGTGVDLLAMGRPEGLGCYCAANNMLRVIVDRMAGAYDYVFIDNEAGMEHLSRRTTRDVDLLLVVSDSSVRGITAAKRMKDLVHEIDTKVRRMVLVLNMAPVDIPPELRKAAEETGLELIGVLPRDPLVTEYDALGKPLAQLPPDSIIRRSVADIVAKVGDVLQAG